MIGEYSTDRQWADLFLPQQKRILSAVLDIYFPRLRISNFHADTKLATDLTVLRSPQLDIGLRVRRPKFHTRFPLVEFTLRSLRDSGVTTELGKIMQGHGGWFGYFHSDKTGELPHWLVIDLKIFRQQYKSFTATAGREVFNTDGATRFRIYRVTDFSVGILMATSPSILDVLPPMYAFALQRRQSGMWNPL